MSNFTKTINVKGGSIRGEFVDGSIASFKGIPYAAPPVKDLRFKPPGEVVPWEGVKDCTEFLSSPLQNAIGFNDLWTEEFLIRNQNFSEDCLTLNLWTDLDKEKQPVIVYLYGGGFVSGGSSCDIYDGTELARRGAIYVTFNHREGTLALFSHKELTEKSEHHASGNYLLMDDIAALKWVKENIASFGGDPDNITLMGQSSGASEVNMLSVSPLTSGLFNNTFSMSFNNYVGYARPVMSLEEGYAASQKLLDNANKTVEDLLTQDAGEFLKDDTIRNLNLDGYVLDKTFKDGVLSGRTNDKVTVMGAVPGDNLMAGFFSDMWLKGERVTEKVQITDAMKEFFKDDYEKACEVYDVDNTDVQDLKNIIDEDFLISSMLYFVQGRNKSKDEKTLPVYIYYYVHPMPGPMAKKFGAFHSCEVPYFTHVFSDLRKEYWQDEDFALGDYLCEELAYFAQNGSMKDKNYIPSDGSNYFRIDAGEKKNVVFPKDKLDLWINGFLNDRRG